VLSDSTIPSAAAFRLVLATALLFATAAFGLQSNYTGNSPFTDNFSDFLNWSDFEVPGNGESFNSNNPFDFWAACRRSGRSIMIWLPGRAMMKT